MPRRHLSWRWMSHRFICGRCCDRIRQTWQFVCLVHQLIRSADQLILFGLITSELLNSLFSHSVSVSSSIGETDNGKWSVSTEMFIFPVQDFCSLHVWMPACVCVFNFYVCVCGQSRWNTKHHVTSLPVGGITRTEGVTAGDRRGRRGVEALCVPQANRPDKIRVEGAQLEAFLSWPLSPPLSHSSKPPAAFSLSVLSVPTFYLLTSLSCFNSSFHSPPPFSLPLHPLFFIFQTISSCLEFPSIVSLLLCGVSPPVLRFTASSPSPLSSSSPSQQEPSKVGSAFSM